MHNGDRWVNTCFYVDSIETRVWSEIACIQLALPAKNQPHNGVTAHEMDDRRCRAARRVDAVQDRRYRSRVDGARHTEQAPFTIKRQFHEKLRGASWTHTGKGSVCIIARVYCDLIGVQACGPLQFLFSVTLPT